MLRKLPLFPFLLAIWPPLALAAKNADSIVTWGEILVPCLVGIGLALGSGAVGKRFVSRWALAWIAAGLVVMGFWWFRPLVFVIAGSPIVHALGLAQHAALLAVGSMTGMTYLTLRRLRAVPSLPVTFLNVFSLLLLTPPIATLTLEGLGGRSSVPLGPPPHAAAPAPSESPDIYLILVDGYGGSRHAPPSISRGQREFENTLRTRGFVVPSHAHANYVWTHLALASMLNGTYAQDLPVWSAERRAKPEPVLDSLIAGNRLLRQRLSAGYELVLAPSSLRPFHSHPWADRTLHSGGRPPTGTFSLHWPRRTPLPELRRLWCRVSACMPRNHPWIPESAADFQTKFEEIGTLSRRGRPMLVLAHVLLPHAPFIVHADCTPRVDPPWPHLHHSVETPELLQYYSEQILCLNTQLLRLVDQILAKPGPDPIILIQSDHGLRFNLVHAVRTRGWTPEELDRWFSIFTAYYAPAETLGKVPEDVTPITAFRLLLGIEPPTSSPEHHQRQFLSTQTDLLNLIEVHRDRPRPPGE